MNKEYTFEALTDIWTGDAKGKPDRTIATGLLGSIRWWFEVLVRGLGGSACDPTRHQCEGDRHCVVCELFGCTGWARKFRFEVLNQSGKTKVEQIKKEDVFQFRFTPLRPIRYEEWALLDLTLRLIAKYGAFGGKTKIRRRKDGIGRRPSNGLGQVRVESSPSDLASSTWQEISSHLHGSRWRQPNHKGFEWAATNKLEALPEDRSPEALLAHLRSNAGGGG
jgi:CRISPR-associated protein Cmr1